MKKSTLILIIILLALYCMMPVFAEKRLRIIDDPFDKASVSAGPDCQAEFRYNYATAINNSDEFIDFLITHQSDVEAKVFVVREEELLPGYSYTSVSKDPRKRIKLDRFRQKVQVYKIKSSKQYNKKIYELVVDNQEFDEVWPWRILVRGSDKGNISIIYCAGK
jgi:hypothetical protein